MIIAKFSTDKQIQLLQFYSWKHMYYRHTHKKIVMIKNVSIPIWLPHYLLIDFSGYAYGIDKNCRDLKREDLLVSSSYMKWLNREKKKNVSSDDLGLLVKNPSAMQKTQVWSLGQEDPLKKGMATHSSILAWRIPWTEEPHGLQSMGVTKELDMTEVTKQQLPFPTIRNFHSIHSTSLC